tara:strand:+ start:2491 stop:2985 length:495 start_codon:yes stop_codon:yes gene_type:complete
MIFYPMLFKLLDAQANEMGYLIGATIHDVAQVIGAGYSVSENTGIIATFVKMVRVSFLPVLIIFLIIMTKPSEGKMPTLPWFLILFFIFALIRNVISLPIDLINLLNLISTWLILVAISAVGMKTNFSLATEIGFKYFLIILLETFFLLLSAILMVWLFRLLDS